MVTSSSNEISTNQLRNMAGGWGWEARYSALPHLFLQQASGQIVKDDVNDFFRHPGYLLRAFLLLRSKENSAFIGQDLSKSQNPKILICH